MRGGCPLPIGPLCLIEGFYLCFYFVDGREAVVEVGAGGRGLVIYINVALTVSV